MMNNKGKKIVLRKTDPLRIVLKCSWSGSRIEVPGSFSPASTLFELISAVSTQLPAPFSSLSEAQPSLVYIRTTCFKHEWPHTSIASIVGENATGSILFTLNLPSTEIQNVMKPHTTTLPRSSPSNAAMDVDEEDTGVAVMNSSESSITNSMTTSYDAVDSSSHLTLKDTAFYRNEEPNPNPLSPKDAIHNLLEQNFDIASKDCLLIILKIVDNIISKPLDPKVRSLRISNPTIHDKIISKKGGLDILLSLGFHFQDSFSLERDRKIVLSPGDEHVGVFLFTRHLMEQVLVQTLGVSQEDIPPIYLPDARGSQDTHPTFDPYKPFAFNVQSAAVGAPDPTAIIPDGSSGLSSSTEQRLDQLKKKQMKIEQELQKSDIWDRNLIAYHPIPTGTIVTVSSHAETDSTFLGSSKGDSSLISERLKRLEEERKKREEGGFTTNAMRQIEQLMKSKVYSHTQIRIDFPTGEWLSAKFLPHEKISTVKDTIRSVITTELFGVQFDLYITPPRRLLIEASTLADENLVPAAKIRVAWKEDFPSVATCIRPEFFRVDHGSSLAYPQSMPLAENDTKPISQPPVSGSNAKNTNEDELIRRMLGKQSSLARPRGK